MTLLGSVIFPISSWVWIGAVLLVVSLILLAWSYHRAAGFNIFYIIAFCLRLFGISVLILSLVEPLWVGRRTKTGENLFLVVADNSSGMNIHDRDMSLSRGQILEAELKGANSDWLSALANNFQIRQFLFDSQLRRTTDFSELVFDGKASAIGHALRTIAHRYSGKPVAGVLLMTDGIATDMPESALAGLALPPVYPVVIGGSNPQKDISIGNVSISQTSFEDAPVTIQADVQSDGYAGKTIVAELVDSSGKAVLTNKFKASKGRQIQKVRFQLRPDKTGILFYNIAARQISDNSSSDPNQQTSEATLVNNNRAIVVDRGKGPYRILYVAGRPNWEYKFLQRAISQDEQLQMVGLLRVARREPKYDWRGRRGEVSNPLYRGFEQKSEEQIEQYDEPVIVRLNTHDETELRGGFPKTEEQLFSYHAIILDDIESGFFTYDQMDLISRFATERGGGFLMLGGKESFQQGGFDRTPISRILPVYTDRLPERKTGSNIYMDLTRQGWLQSWARLRDNELDEEQRIWEMPAFRVLNRLSSVRPGASVIATAGDDPQYKFPALVVQRYGTGRTAALTVGDIWRWGLTEPQMHQDMDKFWRQMLRWLVADVPNRISLQVVDKQDDENQSVVFQVCVHDKDFKPMDNVSVAIDVHDPQNQNLLLTAEPVLGETGLFEAVYVPRQTGCYLAHAVVTDANSAEVGDAQAGLAVNLQAREFQSINANRPLLERIARQTGGEVITPGELGSFVAGLPGRSAPITETWIRHLWDLHGILPMVFLLVLTCFVGEWALRRWKGLP
jgi:uncharacterized membrane protein